LAGLNGSGKRASVCERSIRNEEQRIIRVLGVLAFDSFRALQGYANGLKGIEYSPAGPAHYSHENSIDRCTHGSNSLCI